MKLVDLEGYRHGESKPGNRFEGAILFSTDNDPASAVWLPKSQIEVELTGMVRSEVVKVTVTLPEWLAIEKELV